MSVHAWAALSAKTALVPFSFDFPPLADDEIEIKVTHCGICHSDLHMVDNDWGETRFPIVPGHEVIGIVTKAGPRALRYKPGDRIGVGWQAGACLSCDYCNIGNEQFCAKSVATIIQHHGGYGLCGYSLFIDTLTATALRVQERLAVKIPDSLASDVAAPLLCAGATVYSPLRDHVRAWHTVGVLGVGGLGHVALQFARAFGCEVIAFSTSPDKEVEARKFGASKFVNINDPEQVKAAASTIDVLLNTASAKIDTDQMVKFLKPLGKYVLIGVPSDGTVEFDVKTILFKQRTVTSSLIAGSQVLQEMINFAGRHNIVCQIQTMKLDQANEALEIVRANKARYRMVLVIE